MPGPADYSEKVMEHFMHPRNVGEIPDADGIGKVGNPVCVVPSTLIHTNPRVSPISDITIGTRVLSADGKYHRVKRVFSRQYSGVVYTIGVNYLGEIILTPGHHVLALRGPIRDWMMACELKRGDFVVYPISGIKNDLLSSLRGGHKAWYDDNYFYTPIKYIKRSSYNGNVYNLEVEENHSFVTNAAVLHNCGDIMALYIKVDGDIISDARFKTFGCLPAGEEVVSGKGGWDRISEVKIGAPVINSKGIETRVVETYKRNYKGDMLTIIPSVSPYNRFSLTTEHPVLAIKRSGLGLVRKNRPGCDWLRVDRKELGETQPDFVKASDLKCGDYLIYTFNKKVVDNPSFTIDKMRLIGYYLSRGYICANGSVVAFAFNNKEKELAEDVKWLIKKIIGKEAKERIRGDVKEVYVCSRQLAHFLYSAGGKLLRHKSISEEILSLPFKKQWEMIKTYIAGDGDRYRRRPRDSETYRISTVSKNLAIQVQEILARGGIFASIREQYKSAHLIEGRRIGHSGKFVISFKLQRDHRFVHNGEGYFLVPIRRIEKRYFEGPVYNFQVASEPNTYLVKGFAVHNCGAAIATSSMVTELVKGKTIDEALKISNKAVAEALGGLPPIKMHCSLLAEQALKAALEDYFNRRGLPLPWTKKEVKEHEHEIFE